MSLTNIANPCTYVNHYHLSSHHHLAGFGGLKSRIHWRHKSIDELFLLDFWMILKMLTTELSEITPPPILKLFFWIWKRAWFLRSSSFQPSHVPSHLRKFNLTHDCAKQRSIFALWTEFISFREIWSTTLLAYNYYPTSKHYYPRCVSVQISLNEVESVHIATIDTLFAQAGV